MMLTKMHWTIAMASALLLLSLGVAHGKENITEAFERDGSDSIEDGIEEVDLELARLCTDASDLQYLHFNANMGSIVFKDCTWVGDQPGERCTLTLTDGQEDSKGNKSSKATATATARTGKRTGRQTQTPLMLSDKCPLSCGLCPSAPLEPGQLETDSFVADLERNADFLTSDLTVKEIKLLDQAARRRKRNRKTKTKNKKPCNCPDGHGGGDGDDDDDDDESSTPTGNPSLRPSLTLRPTVNPTLTPSLSLLTMAPTAGPPVSAPTVSPTVTTSTSSSTSSSSGSTTTSTFWTSSSSTIWSSSSTTISSTSDSSVKAAVDGTAISAVQSGVNNQKRSKNRMLATVLSVVPLLILLLIFCCLVRKRKRTVPMNKLEDDTDESDDEYPILQTKSADSIGSRFLKVIGYFNGRQNDEQVDVHRCKSAICDVCDPQASQVMSMDSYDVIFENPTKVEEGERYRVKEVEC